MTGPNYVYDMEDVRETDYRTEFNNVWKLWRECKEEYHEQLTILEGIEEPDMADLKQISEYVIAVRAAIAKARGA